MNAREWTGWIAATIVVAIAVHVASVWYLPHAVMHIALSKMGVANTIHHQKRVDEHARGVVRPSPDLLYSACPFDLSNGALEVKAPVPPGTYWSVSVFDANTNNIFALNDQKAGREIILHIDRFGGFVDYAYVPGGRTPIHVYSPTTRGLVLFRTLVNEEKNFAKIDAVRRQASCAPLKN